MAERFGYETTNPFSTSQTSPSVVPYRFAPGVSGLKPHTVNSHLESMLGKLQETRRALIVGPHGTGKTTLLHTFLPKLQQSFPQVAFHHLASDPSAGMLSRLKTRWKHAGTIRQALARLPNGGLLIVDGWEQLGRFTRYRLLRSAFVRGVTILATAHRRHPGWTVLSETSTSPEMIRALVKDLTSSCPHKIQTLVLHDLANRTLHTKTNVRELWFELYDKVAQAIEESRDANPFGTG